MKTIIGYTAKYVLAFLIVFGGFILPTPKQKSSPTTAAITEFKPKTPASTEVIYGDQEFCQKQIIAYSSRGYIVDKMIGDAYHDSLFIVMVKY